MTGTSKHDAACLQRRASAPFLCTCQMTDLEVENARRGANPHSRAKSGLTDGVESGGTDKSAPRRANVRGHGIGTEVQMHAKRTETTPASGRDTLLLRCSVCGHGDGLWATASLTVRGRVGDDTLIDLSSAVEVEQDGPDLDAIECEDHPDAVIEAMWRERGVWLPVTDFEPTP